ncbi:hypothetical protein DPMN_053009 [Dreissena polymorpha]|uniref:HAT C-terminal dimerisation domain-containing protein n=1 Tax=Dreissena polymorpha TaxID=45954 RepID=A0A9D4CKK8_DREPO|nr:hypothetical protein DPMN_053009 [Dreissena polymorpha]
MRGQGYDDVSNMSGKQKGVQALIQAIVARSVYTHCKACWLNLAIIHASDSMYVKNMMATVLTIVFAFDYSAKRLLRFYENLETDAVGTEQMGRRKKLQCLHVLLCMPLLTATAEGSFCTMRRVKTYLHSTMGTERTFGFALLNINREQEIDLEEVVDVFVRQKERRCRFYFVCNVMHVIQKTLH